MKLTLENKIISGFVAALVLLLVIAFASFRSNQLVNDAVVRVKHTQEVVIRLFSLLSAITDADTGMRGYTITGDEVFLEPYHRAVADADAEKRQLRKLMADNPRQQQRLNTLESLIAARLALVANVVELRRIEGFTAAQGEVARSEGKQIDDRIRQVIAEMEQEENQLLQQREQQARASGRLLLAVTLAGSLVGLVMVAGAIVIIHREFIARRLAEEERERLTSNLQLLLESTGEGIYGIDLEGRFTFLNLAASNILGFERRELLGRNAHEVIHHAHLDRSPYPVQECPIYKAFRTGQSCHLHDELLWCKDGNSFPAEYASYPIRQKGVMIGTVVTFHDVTERKQAEEMRARNEELRVATEQAHAADRIKSAFLATMSHELRTPLNSIIGFTGIILQGLAGPLNAEQNKQLEMVRGSARHLLALINDVLDISKIEAGQLEVAREPFDLRGSITKVAGIVTPLAEKKGLALRVQLAPEISEVIADSRRVEQILLNLLNNAIKFTERGEVTLTADLVSDLKSAEGTSSQPAVRLRVSDTGIGIKPEDLATLFQPFRQINSSLSRNHEGTGLGLAICRRLADLMGGEMRVESEWGKGSTFSFTLPLKGPLK